MRTLEEIYDGMDENEFMLNISDFSFFASRVLGYEIMPFHKEWIKMLKQGKRIAIQSFTGSGKSLRRGSIIIMYDGSTKKVEDVKVGDVLMGDDSTPRRVLALGHGTEEMYKMVPTKGDPITFNKSHILSLKRTNDGSRYVGEVVDIHVQDYLKKNKGFKHVHKGFRVPVEFKPMPVPIDPYFVGIWLADGNNNTQIISTPEPEVICYLEGLAKSFGYELHSTDSRGCKRANIVRTKGINNKVFDILRELNLLNNKHIPNVFKINSREVRLQILAGLLDSDGHLHDNCYEIITKYDKLNEDILYLARSLGLAAYSTIKIGKIKSINFEGEYHKIQISGNTNIIPCKVKRKKAIKRKQKKDVLMFGFDLEDAGIGEYYGFMLDGNGRYLVSDFTVTHNTSILGDAYCLWKSFTSTNKQMCIVSKTLGQSTKILNKIKDIVENNEFLIELIPSNRPASNWCSATSMELSTGCKIFCRPYSENIKGIHVDYLLGDEVASYADYDIWYRFVVTRVNAKNGICVAISTPDNIADLMQELLVNPEYIGKTYGAIIGNMETGKSIWPSNWSMDKLRRIRNEMGIAKFQREYICNARAEAENALYPPHILTECFDYHKSFLASAMGGTTIISGDFAISDGPRADFDAYIVINKQGSISTILHGEIHKGFPISAKIHRLEELYHQYKKRIDDVDTEKQFATIKFVIDPSSVGTAVLEGLRAKGVPVECAQFDAVSRNAMLINLRQAFENKEIIIPRDTRCPTTIRFTDILIKELISMVETRTPRSNTITYQSKAPHDDTVFSLAMGVSSIVKQKECMDMFGY